MKARRGRVIVNAAGIAAFLFVASVFWLEPEAAGVAGANGGAALAWFPRAVPILLIFAVADVVWLVVSLWKAQGRERLRTMAAGAMIFLAWAPAFLIDNARREI